MPASTSEALRVDAVAESQEFGWLAWAKRGGLLLAALLWLTILWHLPNEPLDLRAGFLLAMALEVVLLLAALALLPALRQGFAGVVLRHVVALVTLLLVILCLADLGVRVVLDRPLTPLLDLHLAPAVVNLLSGSLAGPIGWLAAAALLLSVLLVYGLSARAVAIIQRALADPPLRWAAFGAMAATLLVFLVESLPAMEGAIGADKVVDSHASLVLWHQWQRSRTMMGVLNEFKKVVKVDHFRDLPANRLMSGLHGADVLLVFFESYGRSALEQPPYADRLVPRLEKFDLDLAAHGLVAASGYLTSPTMGGQSWLAHGTLESGLWLTHQSFYDAFVASGRLTLTKAFAKAGYRTVALKPAITKPWPEGRTFGFQQIYATDDLGYAGTPYDWVTMPDQYTFSAFERYEREPRRAAGGGQPIYAEFSLISSHAPWTQIPPVLDDWSAIGDGAIFSQWANLGDPPEVVWRNPDRLQDQYGRSVEYVLDVLASYAARYLDDHTLMIVVGDHQPAPLITGLGVGHDVPIHVISGNPKLLDPFLNWGMVAGMVPATEAPVRRMDVFRDWFLEAFSD